MIVDYGKGYKWNPQWVELTVGDTVAWEWLVPTYVTGIGYTIQQTADEDSVDYDGEGFIAGPRSAQGEKMMQYVSLYNQHKVSLSLRLV